jgi:hypothetical protein
VLIYDVEDDEKEQQPKRSYDGQSTIVNCAWGSASNNWIGVAYDSSVETVNFEHFSASYSQAAE